MTTGLPKMEFLIAVAQARDARAESQQDKWAIQHREKAFEYRKLARELRMNLGESLTREDVLTAQNTLEVLRTHDGVSCSERDAVTDAINAIDGMNV